MPIRFAQRRRRALPALLAGTLMLGVPAAAPSRAATQTQARQGSAPAPSKNPNSAPSPPPPAALARAASLTAEGAELLRKRDFSGAEQAFRHALALAPHFADARRGLGMALWNQGHSSEAFNELTLAAQFAPDDAAAHAALARLAWLLAQGPQDARPPNWSGNDLKALAVSELEKAVTLRPKDFDSRANLAEMDLGTRHFKEALGQAKQSASLAASQTEKSRAHLTLGEALYAQGEVDPAADEFKAALAADPSNGRAYLGLGRVHLEQRQPALAQEDFRKAIQVEPSLAAAYRALGELLAKSGQGREAREALEKAVALDPTDWQSQFRLARMLMEAGETAQAAGLLKQVAKLRPDYLPAQEQLALLSLGRGEVDGAARVAQQILRRNPQAVEGHRLMALVLWKQHATEAALVECNTALDSAPDSLSMLALRAIGLWQMNQKREAAATLRHLAKLASSATTAEGFCRLIACGAPDISAVHHFLRQTRWVLEPAPAD